MKRFFKYLGILATVLTGCELPEAMVTDRGEAYFPLHIGMYWVYAVDETRYTVSDPPASIQYELRVEVTDSFSNDNGTVTWVLARSTRDSPDGVWAAAGTWSVIRNEHEVIVREGNTPFVRLAFPLFAGASWDGNRFNTLGNDEYEVSDFNVQATVRDKSFENALSIWQENNGDVIVFLDQRHEMYARDVGLIKKEFRQLHFCTDDACRGQQKVEEGLEYTQELIDHGQI